MNVRRNALARGVNNSCDAGAAIAELIQRQAGVAMIERQRHLRIVQDMSAESRHYRGSDVGGETVARLPVAAFPALVAGAPEARLGRALEQAPTWEEGLGQFARPARSEAASGGRRWGRWMDAITRRFFAASSLSLLSGACGSTRFATGLASPAGSSAPRLQFGTFGVDLNNRDLSARPGDDFYRYCSGRWLDAAQIPADRSSWGTGSILAERVLNDLKVLIESIAAFPRAPGSNEQKIADFYNAFIDPEEIDRKGMAPAQASIEAISQIGTHADLWSFACRYGVIAYFPIPVGANFPIVIYAGVDARDPDKYCLTLSHAGLGLPDRDYYLRDEGEFPSLRAQYRVHVERQLAFAGRSDATAKAQAILSLETEIARRHWPLERRRDVGATYNKLTRAELVALKPDFPWSAGLQRAGVDHLDTFIAAEFDTIEPLTQLVLATPVTTWKAYLTFHLVRAFASALPAAIDAEDFDFFGRILNGQPAPRQRWKRAIGALDVLLGDAVGKAYVERHFSASAKTQVEQLVENMRRAFGARIDRLPWMSPETKVAAREKLHSFRPKIGYPDRWRDYSRLEIRPGDAFGNLERAIEHEWRRQISRLDVPADRSEWFLTTLTVDAYYNPDWNEIQFPAAILQPPFFDPGADAAVNYGAIGAVIGHEMGHGFDDQGARRDARGLLRDWWSGGDVQRFEALGDRLAAQYDVYSPLPGMHVNGRLTLGENIADLGGLQVAYEAYRRSLAGQSPPVIDGVTGDQRFFLAY